VYLPVMERAPALTPVAPGMPAARGCTILLVEDEAPLRALARRMLERRGHVVLEATDSRHALELAREHQGIDLLLTDVVMPGMNGRELSELVTAERPSIRTIFMSGYTDDVIVRRGALSPRLVLLHKPFTAEELAEAVARVMS
jgi:two-component system cell cycle sensor histidine kinase/response regulator CckA